MKSLEHELGLVSTSTESSYFDYIEQKLAAGQRARASVVESGATGNGLSDTLRLAPEDEGAKVFEPA